MSEPGYYFVAAPCAICRRVFTFNPELVPSIPALPDGTIDPAGEKLPVCALCMAKINAARVDAGMTAIQVLPGAYEPAQGFPP